MQRAGGVALFPEDAPAPKASGWLSAKREPRRGRKGPRATSTCAVSPVPDGALRGHGRGRSRYPPKRSGVAEGDVNQGCGTLLGEADCTGLAPEAVYVYGGNRRLSVTRAVHESTRSESEGERVE